MSIQYMFSEKVGTVLEELNYVSLTLNTIYF